MRQLTQITPMENIFILLNNNDLLLERFFTTSNIHTFHFIVFDNYHMNKLHHNILHTNNKKIGILFLGCCYAKNM